MSYDVVCIKIFKALGHPIRYRIINILGERPMSVSELIENVEFSQANLSQHLRVLKDAGIVKFIKSGPNITYELSNKSIKKLMDICAFIAQEYIKLLSKDSSLDELDSKDA